MEPGTRIGGYDIIGLLGEGGMGQVYRARDSKLARDVALKVLPQGLTDDRDRLARFEREAKVLASLNHPNIAHVYGLEGDVRSEGPASAGPDAGGMKPGPSTGGTLAIVMELVEGPTLADRIAEGPIPIAEALPIARQIADALEAAHEQGIIHRDLKPANVKVREDGTVKVLDFGLAKAFDPVGDQSGEMMNSPTLTARATQLGMILGTAAYMAPEQAKGKPVDRRADVWAFGVVLYEMITGKRAFEGSDVSETLASVLAREADWSALPASTPPAIVTLLRQCLERDRKERTPDIAVARFAIREALTAADVKPATAVATPAAPLWRQPGVWTVAAAVALLAGTATWWLSRPVPEPARVGRFAFALPSDPGNVTNRVLAISPSGTHVAFVANRQLWLRRLDDLEPTLLTPNMDDVRLPFFSPDGQQIGFAYDERIKRVAIAGGSPVDVGGPVPLRPFGVDWAGDGFIYVGMENGIARMPETGGPLEMVVDVEGDERAGSPELLPGGEWLLFVLSKTTGSWDEGHVVAESLATHERRVLVEGARDARVVPTGHLLYVFEGTLFGQVFDVGQVALSGGPVSLVDDLRVAAGGIAGDVYYDVSSRGDLLYVTGQNSAVGRHLVFVDRRGQQAPLPSDPAGLQAARISPDGRRIAAQDILGGTDLWLYDVDRPGRQRLTSDGKSTDPVWSPDGEWVYYSSPSQGSETAARRSVWRSRVDLSGQPEEVLKMTDADVAPYSISADGRRLAIEVEQGGESWVAVADLEGTAEPIRLSREGVGIAREPSLSPDGLFVAYASAETGSPQIFVQEVSTGRSRVISTSGGTHPRWSGTGTEIIFPVFQAADIVSVNVISAERLEFSPPEMLMRRPTGANNVWDVSQDGQRLLFAVPEATLGEALGEAPQWEIRVVLNWFEELKARVPVK
jgi:serine/threonine-protein kinase